MVAYFIGLASGFWLGWLARLWRSERVARRRRGGWIRPGASSTTNPQKDTGRQISFSSSPLLGQAWEGVGWPETLPPQSSTLLPTGYGNATGGRVTGLTRRDSAGSAEALTMDQTSSLAPDGSSIAPDGWQQLRRLHGA